MPLPTPVRGVARIGSHLTERQKLRSALLLNCRIMAFHYMKGHGTRARPRLQRAIGAGREDQQSGADGPN